MSIVHRWEVIRMPELKLKLQKALTELRKEKQRKFDQTLDLIVNLQKFDPKKTPVNMFIYIPYKIKEKKIAGFLESKNKNIETITKEEFKKYSNKNELKKLVKRFDFFIAQASLMPKVATTFGKVLGPVGKMPSPQLGIILNIDDKTIIELKNKVNNTIKIRVKEPSIKLAVGKQSMKDEEIIENIQAIYKEILKAMPKEKENIKNIEIKLTMTKPQKIRIR
jgi:large subunit ribosomal protein L1